MQCLSCPVIPVVSKSIKLIIWKLPEKGRFKLNVDGGSCGNPGESGWGGIIQNHKGLVEAGFAHSYGQATNTVAKCRALLDGLQLCKQLGLRDILVESDSTVIVGWLASRICRYWFLWDFWEEDRELGSELHVQFHHIFREANMVADFLAKQGTQGMNFEFCGANSIQGPIRGFIRIDKLSILS
ncbi:14.7 kDa ribonuclease H-like protein [Juglans microcarpa x Juglans regia]|uniref:14.7 kDa ribonuclease H-like protein n=1 Tax=Juglans microcarpa x Juglans regia TaxID=2249226 RepID=UPI001B7E0069|nr:14.7 kDa ribonuclease H-like protein [Juglans microcarpa x Juglans regia]